MPYFSNAYAEFITAYGLLFYMINYALILLFFFL